MSKITRRRLLASSAIAGILAAGEAKARFLGGQPAPAGAQSIIAVSPSTGSFAGGAGSAGAVIATATATMSSGSFTGTWSLSGTNAASFAINSTTGVLAVGASDVANGTYNVNIVATQGGATGSPFSQACVITGSSSVAVASHDLVNVGATTTVAKPYMFGQAFRQGDIPSGSHPEVSGLTTQIDEISPAYPDGSMRHCVITTMPGAVTGGAAARLTVNRVAGSYTPSSTPRAVSEITSGHTFNLKFQEVVDHLNATVGSGNFSFDVNTAIAAGSAHYEIVRNGPVMMGVVVHGKFTDDVGGAASPTLYCEWYFEIYSNPANPANVLYIEHMPFISQPFMDVAGPIDMMVGRCIVKDGSTVLRDFGAESFSVGPSDIGVSSTDSTVSLASAPWKIQNNEAFVVTLQAGAGNALPGGLTNGQHIWLVVYNPGGVGLGHLSPDGRLQNNSAITSAGTAGGGTPTPFIFSARQLVNSYQGIYLPSDNFGTPWRTNSAWADFEMSLDKFDGGTAQKVYWEATGIVPGWDLTLGSSVAKMDFDAFYVSGTINGDQPGGPLYRPGTNGMYSPSIGSGSTNYDYGTFVEWDARCFARQGVSNWTRTENQFWRCQALTASCLPLTQFFRTAFPRQVVVNNNGPQNNTTPPYTSGSGGQYPGLGPSDPNTNGLTMAGLTVPVGYGNGWHNAPFQTTSNPVSDHWPNTTHWQYAFFGKSYFLDQLRRQSNHAMLCNTASADGSGGVFNGSWTPGSPGVPNAAAGYTFYTKIGVGGQERSDMGIIPTMAASVLGSATHPSMAWWNDWKDAFYIFWDYWYNHLNHQGGTDADPGIKTTGVWLWARWLAEPWMMQGYGALTYAWCRNITRHPKSHNPVDACATNWALYWSGVAGVADYFIPGYNRFYGSRQFAPFAPPLGGYGRGTIWPTTQQCYNAYDGFSVNTTGIFHRDNGDFGGGLGSSFSPTTQTLANPMANGDPVVVFTGLNQFNNTTYTGPPEYNPDNTYYVCQMGTNGVNTFRLSTTADGLNPVTVSTAFSAFTISIAVKYLGYNPTPGTGTGNLVGGQNTLENSSYAMPLGAAREMNRGNTAFGPPTIGNSAISFSLALTRCQAWYQVTNIALDPVDNGFRFRVRDTVQVV